MYKIKNPENVKKVNNIAYWGVMVVAVISICQIVYYYPEPVPPVWSYIMGGLSLFFLVFYFVLAIIYLKVRKNQQVKARDTKNEGRNA